MNIKTSVKKIGFLLKETTSEAIEDNVMKLGAAVSYYTIFSLPPLLIILISLSGVLFGEDAVRGTLFGQINGLVGNEAASQIQEAIKNVKLSGNSTFATVLSISVLIIGASGVFAEIQNSINFIWGIKAKPRKGIVKFLKNRLMSFSMIATIGFLLMVGLVINTIMDVLNSKLVELFHKDLVNMAFVLNYLLLFAIITTLFTVIFRVLPDGKVALRDCIIGASVTAFLFMLGKFAIGFYLGNAPIISVYGAAGSMILILVWVYYSAIILFFGAEFTKVYAITYGKNIMPNEYTVKIVKEVNTEL
ncbi:MAG: YihY/virulence factor BrkB family protein [Flavobacteriales bacterium]